MSSKQDTIDDTKVEFDSLQDIAVEWTAQNTTDMAEMQLIVSKIHKPYKKTIPIEDKDGKKSTTDKAYIYASIKGKTLPVRLNRLSQDALAPALGSDLSKWNKKIVYCVHQKIGDKSFVTLKPKV